MWTDSDYEEIKDPFLSQVCVFDGHCWWAARACCGYAWSTSLWLALQAGGAYIGDPNMWEGN